MNHNIDIVLKFITPLHISSPERGYYVNIDTGVLHSDYGPECVPLARTMRIALPINLASVENENTAGNSVPVIAANSFRGLLRREAADEIFSILEARGEKIPLSAFHVLTCGTATPSPCGELTIEDALKAAAHPLIGLFGGTSRLVRGSLNSGIGWPIHERVLQAGIVPDFVMEHCVAGSKDVRANRETNNLTMQVFSCRKDAIFAFVNSHAPLVVENYDRSIIANWAASLDNPQAKRGKERGGDDNGESAAKISLHSIMAHEIVLPGTSFYLHHSVNSSQIGDAGMGLYIVALSRLANVGRIGGLSRFDCGRFCMTAYIQNDKGFRIDLLKRSSDFAYTPNSESLEVATYIDAWLKASEQITAASIEDVCFLTKNKKK